MRNNLDPILKNTVGTDLRTRLRRVFCAGEPTRLDIRVLDTEERLQGRKAVILTDLGGGTSITNGAEIYWPWVCDVIKASLRKILSVELYADEDIRWHGDVVSFDGRGQPNWRPLAKNERAAILAHWSQPLPSDSEMQPIRGSFSWRVR